MRPISGVAPALLALLAGLAAASTSFRAQAPVPGAPAPVGARSGPATPGGTAVQEGAAARTAVIRGRVVAADSGLPLRRAQVMLRVTGAAPVPALVVSTDEDGRYELTELPAGRHMLSASRTGYVTLSYGQRRPLEAGRPVDVAVGQTLDQVDFRLPRGAVIVAHITDDVGDPLAGVFVQAEYYGFSGGKRQLSASANARTNDLGEARLSGIPPGQYYISGDANFGGTSAVLDVSDSGRRFALTYHPGALAAAEAQPVVVGIGQEASVIFGLVPARAARISGVVRRSDGSAPGRISLSITRQITNGSTASGVELRPDGSFSVPSLLPGDYSLAASPIGPASSDPTREYAKVPFSMAGVDRTDFIITTARAASFRAQIVFDGGPPAPDVKPGAVQMMAIFPDPPLAVARFTTNEDWSVDVADLAGTGLLRLRNPVGGWYLKAVTLEGKDITDSLIEFTGNRTFNDVQIVLTRKRSELTGGAVDARNEPAADYAAVLFPEERSEWTPQSRFIAIGRPDQQGRFKISGMPPGRYLAAALDSLVNGEERDPELLDRLQAVATPLTLADGESKSISLKVTARW